MKGEMNKDIRKKEGQKTHILCDSVREERLARSKDVKRTMLKYKSERKMKMRTGIGKKSINPKRRYMTGSNKYWKGK
jgi:hypothetical protein